LHRVHEGGITSCNGGYFNDGRPVAGYLADALDVLIHAGHLALGSPSPTGQHRVCVTHTGQTRYAELGMAPRLSHPCSGDR
ncbi:MAG: hypothetical protein LC808_14620, partial [Actinobacteria bacterium]|nr:hypothetical protein [Actinomycetota bacterium]